MLLAAPDSTAGTRMFRETQAACAPVLRAYGDRLQSLLLRPPVTAPDSAHGPDPPAMQLTPEARSLWVQFHDAVEAELVPGGELHTVRGFGAKMAGQPAGSPPC